MSKDGDALRLLLIRRRGWSASNRAASYFYRHCFRKEPCHNHGLRLGSRMFRIDIDRYSSK